MGIIFIKELTGYLNNLVAYIVIGVFLTATGLIVWFFPETSILEYGYADMYSFFSIVPYTLMFLIPAISMKMFAEERKSGTLEFLVTQPVTDWQIVLAKFLATLALVVVALLPTLVYYFSIYLLGNPIGNIDSAAVFGSYVGIVMLAGAFCSIGILGSSMTENQVVAFVISVFISFLCYDGLNSVANLYSTQAAGIWIEELGLSYHYYALSKGLIDSRDLMFFLSFSALGLISARFVLSRRQW